MFVGRIAGIVYGIIRAKALPIGVIPYQNIGMEKAQDGYYLSARRWWNQDDSEKRFCFPYYLGVLFPKEEKEAFQAELLQLLSDDFGEEYEEYEAKAKGMARIFLRHRALILKDKSSARLLDYGEDDYQSAEYDFAPAFLKVYEPLQDRRCKEHYKAQLPFVWFGSGLSRYLEGERLDVKWKEEDILGFDAAFAFFNVVMNHAIEATNDPSYEPRFRTLWRDILWPLVYDKYAAVRGASRDMVRALLNLDE